MSSLSRKRVAKLRAPCAATEEGGTAHAYFNSNRIPCGKEAPELSCMTVSENSFSDAPNFLTILLTFVDIITLEGGLWRIYLDRSVQHGNDGAVPINLLLIKFDIIMH